MKYSVFLGPAAPPLPNAKPPEVRDGDRLAVGVFQLADEMAVLGIERVDGAVAEIADQQIVAEAAKVRGGHRYGPRLIDVGVVGADQAL